jgi:hypothetical protein
MLIVAKQIPTVGAPSNQATHTRSVVRFGGERRQACNAGATPGGSRSAKRAAQPASTGPAIGAPIVSVTNIRTINSQPVPCHAHQVPSSRQTR